MACDRAGRTGKKRGVGGKRWGKGFFRKEDEGGEKGPGGGGAWLES